MLVHIHLINGLKKFSSSILERGRDYVMSHAISENFPLFYKCVVVKIRIVDVRRIIDVSVL